MDRIFDDVTLLIIKGNSYRGRKCETIALSVGELSALSVTAALKVVDELLEEGYTFVTVDEILFE